MSLALRILLAIVLMAGFYLLALGIAGGLLWIPYAEWVYAHRIHGQIAVPCVVGAGVILWAILPRVDRFEPSGPPLLPAEHPRLFALIREVARAAGQGMPVEVYLDPDLNAWVAQRGGLMGIGSRRVMGIGLPLLAVLRVSQLRAVLAHEFGHYHGGDTRLGPWVYKTRAAIIRTVVSLAEGGHSVLYRPFQAYGKLFLRVTHAVSRRQEISADALSARVAGRAAAASALKDIHGAALAFQPYLATELEPVLGAGCRPPIAEGFVRYLRTRDIASAVDKAVDEELRTARRDPYDTHPPLPERIAALGGLPAGAAAPPDDPPALGLLDRVPEMEARLLAMLTGAVSAVKMQPVDWESVGERVYVPMWTEHVRKHAGMLKGLTPAGLAEATGDLAVLGRSLGADASATKEEAAGRAVSLLGAALALALRREGWSLSAEPGAPVTMEKNGATVEPFKKVEELSQKKLDPAAWAARCAELGIAGLDLGAATEAGGKGAPDGHR